jgi:arylsulfatase
MMPREYPVSRRLLIRPEGGPVSDDAVPMLAGGGWALADVEIPAGGGEGVLFALGDWTGGFAAYVVDGRLTAALCLPGDEIRVRASAPLPSGRHRVGLGLRPDPTGGVEVSLVLDDEVIGTGHGSVGLPFAWQHGGTSLHPGHDRGLPVTDEYTPPFPWSGTLHSVLVDAGRQLPPSVEQARVALQVD